MINSVERRICERARTLEDELVELLSDLININTADPPGENYDQCIQVLKSQLGDIGASTEIIRSPLEVQEQSDLGGKYKSRPNLVARISGLSMRPVLHFNGHYDVVPASGNWTVDPHHPKVQDGRIYGRGASDMKAGIVAMIMSAKVLSLENIKLGGTLSFSFVPDEENDGPGGTRFLIEQGVIPADFCIVGEPTSGLDLCYGHKGSLWLEIITYGKSAHGSRPWQGINAFNLMVEVAKEIDIKIKPALLYQEGEEVSNQIAGMNGTISLGGIVRSGDSLNVIPARCTMTVDRRLAPNENPYQVLDGFRSILRNLERKLPDFKGDMRILSQYPACITPVDTSPMGMLRNALVDIVGIEPKLYIMLGGCDMRFFHSAGIPTAIYGPGIRDMSHQSDEYAEIEKLITATQVYAITAMRLLGVK